ncbi:cytochrome c biogenesis protein CcsA [Croceiramulus getboli]|nr:cytochrome c biogenesis protein CcsA [Flavobacteriaceae bacterium YJPT1-3]
MQDRLLKILFSTRLMAVLFIVYAVAMATGTFLDAGQDTSPTPLTRKYVYNAWWFEAIHLFLVINFIGNIFRYKLLRKEKITTLIFHLAFILILIGAGVTRYVSYEGVMPIKEGETVNTFLSEKTYLQAFIDGAHNGTPERRAVERQLTFSSRLDNDFTWNTDFRGQEVQFSLAEYIEGAEEGFVEDPSGTNHLKIVEAGDGTRHEHFLEEGEVSSIHNVLYALNAPTDGAINIFWNKGEYQIKTPFEGEVMVMATQQRLPVVKDSTQSLQLRALYQLGGGAIQFVIPDEVVKGKSGIVPLENADKDAADAVFVNVSSAGETQSIGLLGGKGYANDKKLVEVGGLKIYLSYGSKLRELPFSIQLNDFVAEKYPGTEQSYSSFLSEVTVVDEEPFDYDIYMNHVLDHEGFRFFQASFFPDESGTILSVSKDFWGTWITYIGYFLLYLGMMAILFDRGSRFGDLKRSLDKVKNKKKKILSTLLILMLPILGFSQQGPEASAGEKVLEEQDTIAVATGSPLVDKLSDAGHQENHTTPSSAQIDSVLQANAVSKEHAAKFGKLVIQDDGGRMMPINTFSSKLLRKLTRSTTYAGLNADQVMLSMLESPVLWYNTDILYLKKGNDSIRSILGVPDDVKRFKAIDFFTPQGSYKLQPYLVDAYSAALPTVFQKEFKDVDQRLGLLNRTLGGEILKIFPIPNHPNDKWASYPELGEAGFKGMDSVYTRQIIPLYLQALRNARQTGDYGQAEKLLTSITDFQKTFGAEIMPSEQKIQAEILYNKYDVFTKLYWMYMLGALFMMIFVIAEIFTASTFVKAMSRVGAVFIVILFLIQTAALIWRWYISGHAPWADAYESVLYVGWATMFFGLAFGRKSMLTIASTAFVAGFILWGASMNWLNPEIANLVPVLNSYWLMIHTAVIVGSYGPFALGAILGLLSLFLMLITTEKNKKKMELNIRELVIITEMALTVGLVMLTIGNFLGGQWANESWGRYWGWDPKETWALISIIVYAFVIHMRLVPGLRGKWIFSLMSVLAFGSVLMTYFGVNFWLSGLHSYASGENIINLDRALIMIASVIVFALLAYPKYKKYYSRKKPKQSLK